jgi:hypothetical protein
MLLINDNLPASLLARLNQFVQPENLDRWVNREQNPQS